MNSFVLSDYGWYLLAVPIVSFGEKDFPFWLKNRIESQLLF